MTSAAVRAAIRLAERFPFLGSLPVPPWVERAIAVHERRRRLVLDIYALSDRHTAFAALWLARAYAVATVGGTVEGGLHAVRALLLRGWRR